ncbi:MAG: 3-hydroxyacyl-[acyl-carrier-protein] dehydratase, FabZ form [Symbiobacteriaceae bacterium]|jgi:3-hydroxyacyl-[acyl-carrier-protein] dehydratase|nr:3-hydroxyacyl-[acyl-carrier-protein] dehydratase, FabZ form [Symbiobacteriaceae bacterium]
MAANPFPMLTGTVTMVGQPPARVTATRRIRADEPYLAGHFPGWPVVPGVLLLKLMRETAALLFPGADLQRVEGLRLLQAVTPETELVAEAKLTGPGQAAATLTAGEAPVARCKLYFSQREVVVDG